MKYSTVIIFYFYISGYITPDVSTDYFSSHVFSTQYVNISFQHTLILASLISAKQFQYSPFILKLLTNIK